MAQYRIPPQREPGSDKSGREPFPWLWLGLGLLITVVGLGITIALLTSFLARPSPEQAVSPGPTVIRLTAPPRPTGFATEVAPTITPAPTLTPAPTPDVALAPPEITAGFYAAVVNTGGIGVTVRGGPGTNNQPITVAAEGAVLLVLDGPTTGGEFQWWQVQLSDGTEGWVAADFLEPAAAPSQ
jgi:hypothetical protein